MKPAPFDQLTSNTMRREFIEGFAAVAVDLGAGLGLHSLPLAQRGYEVIALDSSEPLQARLHARAGALPVRCINAALLEFDRYVQHPLMSFYAWAIR
jgi:2-polyprenyl-3-methyl-5-hydroxy-6-metoxy-1,4-benzoquinol methylase